LRGKFAVTTNIRLRRIAVAFPGMVETGEIWTSSEEVATADARPSIDGYFVALSGRRRKAGT
jgi:hypothetical protein